MILGCCQLVNIRKFCRTSCIVLENNTKSTTKLLFFLNSKYQRNFLFFQVTNYSNGYLEELFSNHYASTILKLVWCFCPNGSHAPFADTI